MELLVTAATESEIAELLQICDKKPIGSIPGLFQLTFPHSHFTFHVLLSGAGTPATVFRLTNLLTIRSFDLVIQAGISGAFNRAIAIGECVIVDTDRFGSLGAEDGEQFLDLFELGLAAPGSPPFDNGMIRANYPDLGSIAHLKKVAGITVDTVSGNEKTIAMRLEKYHPDVESMEGAALFFVCGHFQIPCMQIRSISNYVEKRNKLNWNIPLAVNALHQSLVKVLNEINT